MTFEPTPADGSGAMFDGIAARYDRLNRLLSLGMDQRWRRRLVAALTLPKAARVLDIATGTGDVAIAVAQEHQDARVVGLDPSAKMLALARDKVDAAGLRGRVELLRGDGQALPFPPASFDGTAIAFGIRNVPDRLRALAEMRRVTRPGGRVAVLELADPRGGLAGLAGRVYLRTVVPALGGLLSRGRAYRYLRRSVEAFPGAEEFAALLGEAGLEVRAVHRLAFGAANLFIAAPR